MKKFDAIIIGSGLGGLITAAILAKEGQSVLVLEKGRKTGGFLHTFKRDDTVFNTGMNYVGSLEEGGFFYQYLNYLGVFKQLNIKQLDVDGFDEISFADSSEVFRYAQGKENFIRQLLKSFPNEEKAIVDYTQGIWDVSDKFPLLHLKDAEKTTKGEDYLIGGAWEFISKMTSNTLLQNVLAANNSLYAGQKGKTPLYVHALVNRQFIQSAWRFVGGSQQLARALSDKITEAGGEVKNRSEVVKIATEDAENTWVETLDGERYFARRIISNIHPAQTLNMLDDKRIKKVYRKRINDLENTYSFFNLYIVFKKHSFPYYNKNFYHFMEEDVWINAAQRPVNPAYYMFYTSASRRQQEWADNATVLTQMDYKEVEQWKDTKIGLRGREYEAFKQRKAEFLLNELEQKFPGIRSKIQSYDTATPLTYEHYNGAPQGAAFGIQKDHRSIYKSIILPKTKIPNLFLTGHHLNMHGALGVTIGGVLTASEILGQEYLIHKIRQTL